MAFGLTLTGFRIKRLEDVKNEIEQTLRANLGSGINLEPESVFGQLVGIFSERESLLWEQMQAIYNAQYPDTAEGVQLDLACSLVGVTRRPATRTRQVAQYFFGDVGTVIPLNTEITVNGNPTAIFRTQSVVTLVAGTNEVQTISFSAVPDDGTFTLLFESQETNTIAYTDTAAFIQSELENLTSVGVGNISVTGTFSMGFEVTFIGLRKFQPIDMIVVGQNTLLNTSLAVTITVVETTPGVAQGSCDMEATVTGPIAAPRYSLTEISTPIFGLDSTVNAQDALIGRDIESDPDLRVRREAEIQISGASTVGAILAAVSGLAGVEAVFVFENDSPLTDVDGRPPHSIEVVVQGGTEQSILDQIFLSKAAGIGTFGSITGSSIDSNGFPHTIKFSRPTDVPLLLEIDLVVDSVLFPVDGVNAVKQNFVDYVLSLTIGEDVIVIPDMYAALTGIPDLNIDRIPGILRADLRISKKPTPPVGDSNIVIGVKELATLVATDITVTLL